VPGAADTRTLPQLVAAASADDATAMRTLNVYYTINNSIADRRRWLQRAAQVSGSPDDLYEYAYFLKYALDCDEEADRLMTTSAAMGSGRAQEELASLSWR
jgi:DnaJ-domain-containing protein 1